MSLSSDLVSEFAKITNDQPAKNAEGSTAYGSYVVQGEGENATAYVQIDGSDVLTPVATTTQARSGDRVTIMIKNHKAIVTGNLTDPSASGESLNEFKVEVGKDLTGENLISKINMTPGNILIEASHINLVGAVTAETIAAGALEVGKNVTMGKDAVISWSNLPSNVASSREIPSDSEITQITQNAITTGDIIIGGYVYDKTTTGKQIILGVNSSNNLQVGTIFENANYDKIRFYSPGIMQFYPDGQAADDNYTLQLGGDESIIWCDLTVKKGDIYMYSGFEVRNLDNTVKYASKSHTHSDYYSSGDNIYANRLYVQGAMTISGDPNARLAASSPYQLGYSSGSSRKFKHDIKPVENEDIDPTHLYDIEVVQFKYNNDYLDETDQRYGIDCIGFIAEQVNEVYPIAADRETGEPRNWEMRYMIPPMLALIQQQKKEIDILKEKVNALEQKEVA